MITKELVSDITPIIDGLNIVADVVKSTMGGQGKTVIIADSSNNFKFTKDGISVAESIRLENDLENIGAKALISSSRKTVDKVGDGTTATAVLLQSMVNRAKSVIDARDSINDVISGMRYAVKTINNTVKNTAIKVETVDEIGRLATVSSNSERLGKLFKDLYTEVGFNSLVSLENSRTSDTTYFEVLKGITYDSPYVHESFANKDNGTCVLENVFVYMSTSHLNAVSDSFKDMFAKSVQSDMPFVIMAPSFSKAFLRTVLTIKNQSGMACCLMLMPGFGKNVTRNYEDIKNYLSEGFMADKIIVTNKGFTIFNENSPNLANHIKKLNVQLESAEEPYEEEQLKQRIHKLQSTQAIIYAGGITEEAQSEEYDRVEDALGAVTAAIRSGYVQGGGLALYNIKDIERQGNDNFNKGIFIVLKAIHTPIKQIIENANLNVDEILEKVGENIGYNVKTFEYENFYETGIIDPVEVITQALQNALASCILIINASYALYNEYPKRMF